MILKPIFIKVTGTSASEDSVKYDTDDDWKNAPGVFKCVSVGNRYASSLTCDDIKEVMRIESIQWNATKSSKRTILYWNHKDNCFMVNINSYNTKYDSFCRTSNTDGYPNSINLVNVILTDDVKKLKLVDSKGADIYVDVDTGNSTPTLVTNKWNSSIDENSVVFESKRKVTNNYFGCQNIYKEGSNLAYSGVFTTSYKSYSSFFKAKYFPCVYRGFTHYNNLLKPSNAILEDLDLDNPIIDISAYLVDNGLGKQPRHGLFCVVDGTYYFSGMKVNPRITLSDSSVHSIASTYVKYDPLNNDLFGLDESNGKRSCGYFYNIAKLGGSTLISTKSGDNSYIKVCHKNYMSNNSADMIYNGFEKHGNVVDGTVYETENEHQIVFGVFLYNGGNGGFKYTILPKQKIKFLYHDQNNKVIAGDYGSPDSQGDCLINSDNHGNSVIDICVVDFLPFMKKLKLDFCYSGLKAGKTETFHGSNIPGKLDMPIFASRNGIVRYNFHNANDPHTQFFMCNLGNGNIPNSEFVQKYYYTKTIVDYDTGTVIDTDSKTVFLLYNNMYSSDNRIVNGWGFRSAYPYPNP